jgi:hypothetical protein
VGKDDDRKRAEPIVLAKIKVVNASASGFNTDDFAGHTLRLAQVVASLIHGNACRHGTRREQSENKRSKPHVEIVCLSLADQVRKTRKVGLYSGNET